MGDPTFKLLRLLCRRRPQSVIPNNGERDQRDDSALESSPRSCWQCARKRSIRACHVIVAIAWATLQLGSPAHAAATGGRLAVVISNATYTNLGDLKNPPADGQLVSASLRSAGFDVTYLQNLDDQHMRASLRQLARDSAKRDVTLVYYAGHGVQIGGINYLLPVDISPPDQEDDVRLASISADDVISVMKSPYKILILDACRDNPVLSRALTHGRSAAFHRGLAPVSPATEGAGGIFIAYSTQTDAVAMDGEGAYSPFAESFAKYVGVKISIDDMFASVTRDVLNKTNGFQRPFKYASLDTVFCLTGACPSAPVLMATPVAGSRAAITAAAAPGLEAFAQLNATTDERLRTQMEQRLWEQLQATLPKLLLYGAGFPKDGVSPTLWAHIDTAQSDGRRAKVSVTSGEMKNGALSPPSPDSYTEFSVDCATREAVPIESHVPGSVQFYSQEQRKQGTFVVAPESIAGSAFALFCTRPLRLTPLWALESVHWTDLGAGVKAALDVQYRPPDRPDERYVFWHVTLSKPDQVGNSIQIGWAGVNCRTREFNGDNVFVANKNGEITAVLANQHPWQAIIDNSAAANTFVLLCEHQ